MTGWSQIVAELVGAGLSGAALVAACERIDAALEAGGPGVRPSQDAARNETVPAGTGPGDSAAVAFARPLAMARRGVAGSAQLSRSAARVGAVLCDCYDRKTGLSSIGVAAIVARTGLSRATVFRALRALEGDGRIVRLSYAGVGHANAYRLNLPVESETVGRDGRKNETRSQREDISPLTPLGGETVVQKQPRRRPPDPRQREIPLLRADPKARGWEAAASARMGASGRAAAIGQREARESAYLQTLRGQLGHHDGRVRENVLLTYFADERLRRKAVDAERVKPGAGLAVLLAELQRRELDEHLRRAGTGPPGRG